jgi:plasmid stabilization system protein ParE
MARIELAPEVLEDFDRFLDYLLKSEAVDVPERIGEIVQSIDVLAHSPMIGRPVSAGLRELVISKGRRGYVALYSYLAAIDTVFVLAIRSQREYDFKRRT